MDITVQLVVASTGHNLPMTVRNGGTPSHVAGLPPQEPGTRSRRVSVSDLILCVRNCGCAPVIDSVPSWHREQYVECFDYASRQPLRPNDVVADGQKLLLFTPPSLSQALVDRLSSCQNKSKGESEGRERWLNLKQAILALGVPLVLHQEQLERHMGLCSKKLEETTIRFNEANESVSETLERIKGMKVFNDPDSSLIALVDANEIRTIVTKGGVRLREASKYLDEARAMAPDVINAISMEGEATSKVKATETWRHYNPPPVQTERDSAVAELMQEVERKVSVVREILTNKERIRRKQSACCSYCDAVICHVVRRLDNLRRLPEGLEVAHRLMERRVVMRQAIRRLLLPLEEEHRSLQQDLQQFCGRWSDCLPEDLFKAVAAAFPPLYPQNDDVAQDMDRHFVDVEKDKTEEFLLSAGVATVGPSPSDEMMQRRVENLNGTLRLCRAALEAAVKERDKLAKELQTRGGKGFTPEM